MLERGDGMGSLCAKSAVRVARKRHKTRLLAGCRALGRGVACACNLYSFLVQVCAAASLDGWLRRNKGAADSTIHGARGFWAVAAVAAIVGGHSLLLTAHCYRSRWLC